MTELTGANLRTIFQTIGDAIEADKGRLSELDGVIGDADHGVTMSIGFTAVNEALGKLDPSADPTAVFNTAAKSFLNAVGASSGPLYGTAFMRAGGMVHSRFSRSISSQRAPTVSPVRAAHRIVNSRARAASDRPSLSFATKGTIRS